MGVVRNLLFALGLLGFGFLPPAAADATVLKIGGSGTTYTTMRLLAAAFEQATPGVTVTVLPSLGSTGGVKAVLAGAIDIGVTSRPLSQAETDKGAVAVEYGRTPLAFVVPRATRVSETTTAELVDIYSGKQVAWPSGDAIRVIMRPAGDTNTIKLKGLSPEMAEAVADAEKRPGMLFALTDQDTTNMLDTVPGALALTALSEVISRKNGVTVLRLNGVGPDAASLAAGTYPLSLSLFMVTGPTPEPTAAKFIDFVRSEQGRRILAETGHQLPAR